MKVEDFLNGLQNAGYWDEYCNICGKKFSAPNGEDICPNCNDNKENED